MTEFFYVDWAYFSKLNTKKIRKMAMSMLRIAAVIETSLVCCMVLLSFYVTMVGNGAMLPHIWIKKVG